MKKAIFLSLFSLLLAFIGHAQFSNVLPLVTGDTIVNTGTVTKTLPQITSGISGVVLQANITVLSGTGAGTAQLQVSLDNSRWVNTGTAYTITATATQATQFTITAPVPQYVRILFTGSGTETAQVRVWYREPPFQTTSTLVTH